jgi:hypothetical protein
MTNLVPIPPPPSLVPLAGAGQPGESARAIQACNDWLRLGEGRSLPALLARYTKSTQTEPPTRALGTLKKWSMRFDWAGRAGGYDAAVIEQAKNARRAAILEAGLALDYERVAVLSDLAQLLVAQVAERNPEGNQHRLWVPNVKAVGSGPWTQIVDIERFNAPLLSELRGVLDDIAQEVGGRIRKQELTGKNGGPIASTSASVVIYLPEKNPR